MGLQNQSRKSVCDWKTCGMRKCISDQSSMRSFCERRAGDEDAALGVEVEQRLPALGLPVLDQMRLVQDQVLPLLRQSWHPGSQPACHGTTVPRHGTTGFIAGNPSSESDWDNGSKQRRNATRGKLRSEQDTVFD